MTLLSRNFIVSVALALSDFISFIISIYLAIELLSFMSSQNEYITHLSQNEGGLHYIGC